MLPAAFYDLSRLDLKNDYKGWEMERPAGEMEWFSRGFILHPLQGPRETPFNCLSAIVQLLQNEYAIHISYWRRSEVRGGV